MMMIPHIKRIFLATEETRVTQEVSHRPIKCQFRLWSQRDTKVNWSHHGDNPLLRPTGMQIATKYVSGLTNRQHRKLIGVKTMSLGMNYSFYCCIWSPASILKSELLIINTSYDTEKEDCLMCCPSNKIIKSDKISFQIPGGLHEDKFIDAPSPEGRS